MPRQDTLDFITAFAVGTILGVGATLLLQPDPSPKAKVARQLKPYKKQIRKSYKEMSRGVSRGLRSGSEATSEMTSEVISAGRELLGEFREEVGEILEQARADLGSIVAEQAKELRKSARRTRGKVGL
jgi:gas vesicle protein